MYGLVNQAIEDLVTSNYGKEAWISVKSAAGFEDIVFVDTQNYDDSLTFKLLQAASEIFMQSPETLLRLFGRHWIMFTYHEGWHDRVKISGRDVVDFIQQLGILHDRVIRVMPEARMPTINVRQVTEGFEIEYISERAGLALFFQGIVEGLVEYYEEPWVVERVSTAPESGVDRFQLRPVDAVLKLVPARQAA